MTIDTAIAIIGLAPTILGPTIYYFVRLEKRLTKIETTLNFILGNITGCLPHSDKNIS